MLCDWNILWKKNSNVYEVTYSGFAGGIAAEFAGWRKNTVYNPSKKAKSIMEKVAFFRGLVMEKSSELILDKKDITNKPQRTAGFLSLGLRR